MTTNSPTQQQTETKHTAAQTNYTFNSARHLAEWETAIRAAYAKGRVYVEQAGYGSKRYAMLNVVRFFNGEQHTVNIENNGLPSSWIKALAKALNA